MMKFVPQSTRHFLSLFVASDKNPYWLFGVTLVALTLVGLYSGDAMAAVPWID